MELVYTLSGGGPIVKRYLASAAISSAGIVLECDDAAAISTVGSVSLPAASTVGGDHIGINVDTAASFPADPDGQVNADADVFVTVIINPDAVFRAKMSGSSTADTALTLGTAVTTADSLGEETAITSIAGGAIWGYSGANAGYVRAADTTTGNVAVSFPNAIAVGDVYLHSNVFPGKGLKSSGLYFDLTTNLTQVVAQTAVTDMLNFAVVDGEFNDESNEGTTNSYYHLVSLRHIFSAGSGAASA